MHYPYISVSLHDRALSLVSSSQSRRSFPIAVGKPKTPTPKGLWYIINKKIITEPNVFGSRWLGLNNAGYGIHGTNQPEFIGQAISGGCIRMHNNDIQFLFSKVTLGTAVYITE